MQDWRSYDAVAPDYARIHAPRLAEPARDLVAMAAPTTSERILDVGTGTGVAAAAVAAAAPGALVVGIDASLGMLAQAGASAPGIPFAAARTIDLPFRDGTFDVAVAAFVLAHFTKVDTALFDVKRVLRRGGRFAASAWTGRADQLQATWLELVHEVVPPDVLGAAIGNALPWHDRLRRREALEETLIDAGFRHVRVEEAEYHFRYGLDEYVDGLGTWATGRFVHSMLGDAGWEDFIGRARERFRERFADPLNDFRRVLLGVGTKA